MITTIILGLLAFVLGYKYLNYLELYMQLRFGMIKCKCGKYKKIKDDKNYSHLNVLP